MLAALLEIDKLPTEHNNENALGKVLVLTIPTMLFEFIHTKYMTFFLIRYFHQNLKFQPVPRHHDKPICLHEFHVEPVYLRMKIRLLGS